MNENEEEHESEMDKILKYFREEYDDCFDDESVPPPKRDQSKDVGGQEGSGMGLKLIPGGYCKEKGYQNAVDETIEVLEAIMSDLHHKMISLALCGTWRQWAEEQPIGTVFNF